MELDDQESRRRCTRHISATLATAQATTSGKL